MNNVYLLDCTLRDGGYCNKWNFGSDSIPKIIESLIDSGIDIVECGFVTDRVSFDKDCTKYPSVESVQISDSDVHLNATFVAMINYGEFDAKSIPVRSSKTIDGIRLAFHKKNIDEALKYCSEIKSKGYLVFVQAMVSISYSDSEFLSLINKVNELEPYAFYIVDSFGNIQNKDLMRYFYLADNNLKSDIVVGFHSHNNLQLAYSNARSLVEIHSNRSLIIDSTIYGMGRGAGNLNTELFIQYLNNHCGKKYNIKPLLEMMDEIINKFYLINPWGYSLPNYLSAVNNAHPNYAAFFSDKDCLTIDAMNELFELMDSQKKFEFDKAYAEEMYLKYMESGKQSELHKDDLARKVIDSTVLLIGPAMSSKTKKDKIIDYSKKENVVCVSINHAYQYCETDFIFVSNMRRFMNLSTDDKRKSIITSNIVSNEAFIRVNYRDLLINDELLSDNAGLMAIKLFHQLGANNIVLAGFDGYSYNSEDNYADSQMTLITKKAILKARNVSMSRVLSEIYQKGIISFLIEPRHYAIQQR